MSKTWHRTLSLVIVCSLITSAACLSVSFPLGQKERRCFFQDVHNGAAAYAIDVFVFQGGGAHDLRMTVEDKVQGEKLSERISKVHWEKKFEFEAGDQHEICLLNARGSKEDTKHVMLTVDRVTDTGSDTAADSLEGEGDEKQITKSANELGAALQKIRNKFLEEEKAMAERRTAVDDNRRSMKNSSIVETLVLLVVSLGQIFFVRHWFQGKGTILKRWM